MSNFKWKIFSNFVAFSEYPNLYRASSEYCTLSAGSCLWNMRPLKVLNDTKSTYKRGNSGFSEVAQNLGTISKCTFWWNYWKVETDFWQFFRALCGHCGRILFGAPWLGLVLLLLLRHFQFIWGTIYHSNEVGF